MPSEPCKILNDYLRKFCIKNPSITCEKLLVQYEEICEYKHRIQNLTEDKKVIFQKNLI